MDGAGEGGSVSARSSRADVRNPIAGDPEVAAIIASLPPEARTALEEMLRALSKKWRVAATQSWAKHKAPMAAYHKANAINARHLALALRRPAEAVSSHLVEAMRRAA